MKAHKFVAVHGIEKAKAVLEGAPDWSRYYSTVDGEYYLIELNAVNLKQLKQVVESVNKINDFGGIGLANLIDQSTYGENLDLDRAIADYKLVQAYKNGEA